MKFMTPGFTYTQYKLILRGSVRFLFGIY